MAETSQGASSSGGSNIPYTHRPVFPQRGRGQNRRFRGNSNRDNQQMPAEEAQNSPDVQPSSANRGAPRGRSNWRGAPSNRGRTFHRSSSDVRNSGNPDNVQIDGPSKPEMRHNNRRGGRGGGGNRGIPDIAQPDVSNQQEMRNNRRGGRGGGGGGNRGNRGSKNPPPDAHYHFNINAEPFVPSIQPPHPSQIPPPLMDMSPPVPVPQQERSAAPRNQRRGNSRRPERGQNKPPRGGQNARNVPSRKTQREENPDQPLRERLINSLEDNDYECMICCQLITAKQGIWTCKMCYHMFHISGGCIVNWAKKSREEDGKWRCPTCQTKNSTIPYNYYCFCGKHRNPTSQIGETPHSCGNVCGGERGPGCPHPCNEPCHPGPCIECPAILTRKCNCGALEKTTRCGAGVPVSCERVCDKLLSCGIHRCVQICHSGSCQPCEEVLTQKCYCGQDEKSVPCHSVSGLHAYSCGQPCKGKYDCGLHNCEGRCHSTDGSCGPCALSPLRISSCPCGKSLLSDLGVSRSSCTDPVPTCDSICNKILICGSAEKPHRCRSKCHTGPCPPCDYNTSVICRCKQVKRTVPCKEYVGIIENGEFLCEKRCKKKKSCGLHKCQETCCVQEDHYCMQVCNKRLSCGQHNCEALCHLGECGRCLNASFEEQFCHCGHTMRPPPIPCGAPLPECDEPCARPHSCNHRVTHKCHSDSVCPPCTVLVERECYGGHEVRNNIPCHIQAVSCGRECGKLLSCGVHTCPRRCHFGECLVAGEKCTLPCAELRTPCEHTCGLPCHRQTPCPETVCNHPVAALCDCGRRKEVLKCFEVEKAKQRLRAVLAANAAENTGVAETQPPEEGTLKRTASMENLSCLSCNDECKKIARNKKIADALSIVTNDDGDIEEPTVTFTETMKAGLKAWPQLVASLEKIFTGMIDVLNDMTQSSNVCSYNFPPMPMDKRRLVHEYANFFHLETQSVDVVPKRSVIVTGRRGVAKPPLIILSDLHKYPSVLKFTGSTTLRSNPHEEAKAVAAQPEDSGMKSLRTERKVVKRMAPKIVVPDPVKQRNAFALLCSDDEAEEHVPPLAKPVLKAQSSHERDADWWSDEEVEEEVTAKETEAEEEQLEGEEVVKKMEEVSVSDEAVKESWSDEEAPETPQAVEKELPVENSSLPVNNSLLPVEKSPELPVTKTSELPVEKTPDHPVTKSPEP